MAAAPEKSFVMPVRRSDAPPPMAHEIAKLLLEHAGTFLERTEAVKTALGLGMPLDEIEAFLDWLDMVRGPLADEPPDDDGEEEDSA